MTTSQAADWPVTPLVVATVPVELPREVPLTMLLPRDEPVTWLRRGEGLVGWGVAAQLRTRSATRFADADKWWTEIVGRAEVRDEVMEPGTGLVAFGSFAFADDPGDSVLLIPRVIVGRRGDRAWVTTIGSSAEAVPDIRRHGPARAADRGRLR